MGESVTEGTVTKWLKKVGDTVAREELLYEVSTDKVDTEIPSPVAGVLEEIVVAAGDVAKVGAVVARIRALGAHENCPPAAMAVPDAPARGGAENGAVPMAAANSTVSVSAPTAAFVAAVQTLAGSEIPLARERILASPLARHMAKEQGIDLAYVAGTGSGGRIMKADVNAYAHERSAHVVAAPALPPVVDSVVLAIPKPQPLAIGREERVPMTTMRKKIAEHMVMSKRTSPHVTSIVEVNVQKIVDARKKHAAEFERVHGMKLSYTPFLLSAAIAGLKAVPIMNSSIDGDTIVFKKDINLGVAVALEQGLIVPVLKSAQDLSFVGIARGLNDLAERARNKKLMPDDVKGGSFSVTNYGVFGTLIGQPIINQPQVGIMGVGTFEKRPVVIDDAIAIRTMAYVVCSYDHRVIDGADGGRFLAAVKAYLENWNGTVV
jgi:2-oxoglutarate dehydrogenase E2 component (dihydrolipoamide succinyltransferase)